MFAEIALDGHCGISEIRFKLGVYGLVAIADELWNRDYRQHGDDRDNEENFDQAKAALPIE